MQPEPFLLDVSLSWVVPSSVAPLPAREGPFHVGGGWRSCQ